jgi:hypothetical protein
MGGGGGVLRPGGGAGEIAPNLKKRLPPVLGSAEETGARDFAFF